MPSVPDRLVPYHPHSINAHARFGVGNQWAIIDGRRWYFSTRGQAIFCFAWDAFLYVAKEIS
jgi:hypothetical protein